MTPTLASNGLRSDNELDVSQPRLSQKRVLPSRYEKYEHAENEAEEPCSERLAGTRQNLQRGATSEQCRAHTASQEEQVSGHESRSRGHWLRSNEDRDREKERHGERCLRLHQLRAVVLRGADSSQ